MNCLVIKLVIPVILVPVFLGAISLRVLLQSVVRRLPATGVTPPTWAPFSKMPNMKIVVALTVLHIGGIGSGFSIRGRRVIC